MFIAHIIIISRNNMAKKCHLKDPILTTAALWHSVLLD